MLLSMFIALVFVNTSYYRNISTSYCKMIWTRCLSTKNSYYKDKGEDLFAWNIYPWLYLKSRNCTYLDKCILSVKETVASRVIMIPTGCKHKVNLVEPYCIEWAWHKLVPRNINRELLRHDHAWGVDFIASNTPGGQLFLSYYYSYKRPNFVHGAVELTFIAGRKG